MGGLNFLSSELPPNKRPPSYCQTMRSLQLSCAGTSAQSYLWADHTGN